MTPPRLPKGIRFPMFLKFLFGCLLLAGFLIFGGAWLVSSKQRLQNRGKFLVKHLQRYDSIRSAPVAR